MFEALAEAVDGVRYRVTPGFLLDSGRAGGNVGESPARFGVIVQAVRQTEDRSEGGRKVQTGTIGTDMRERRLTGAQGEEVLRKQAFSVPTLQHPEHFLHFRAHAVVLQVAVRIWRPGARHHTPGAKDRIERAIPGVKCVAGHEAERRTIASLAKVGVFEGAGHGMQLLDCGRRTHAYCFQPVLT